MCNTAQPFSRVRNTVDVGRHSARFNNKENRSWQEIHQRFLSRQLRLILSNTTALLYTTVTLLQKRAVRELAKSGFDMKTLSIIGKDYSTEEGVVGFYNAGDRMRAWGKTGAFWGGLWGMLFASALFVIPGVGPLFAAGPLVAWIIGALEGAAVIGGMSALGAGLYSVGIPKDSILDDETQIKAGKFVVVAHGPRSQVEKSRTILSDCGVSHRDDTRLLRVIPLV
jgi:hypothetical protein